METTRNFKCEKFGIWNQAHVLGGVLASLMDDESECEGGIPDSPPKPRDWQWLHARQERGRQWIAGVMG